MKIKHLIVLAISLLALAGCKQQASVEQVVLDNIFARRSVRTFTEQDVTEQQVETLLKAAMAAPSGMNLQPWRFVVVRDSRIKERLASREGNEFIKTAPVVIVVCAENIQVEDRPNLNWTADCAAATENLLLAAQAMGLGACWTACYPYPERQRDADRALKLAENIRPYAVVPVGYPGGNDAPKDKWKPENVHYEHWDDSPASDKDKNKTGIPMPPHRINKDLRQAPGK